MQSSRGIDTPYVKDGLVFLLDADDFDGGATWVDRVGGVVFDNFGATKVDNHANFTSGTYLKSIIPVVNGNDFTLEIVLKVKGYLSWVFNGGNGRTYAENRSYVWVTKGAYYIFRNSYYDVLKSVSAQLNKLSVNGVPQNTYIINSINDYGGNCIIGGEVSQDGSIAQYINGDLYCIRLYNRPITDEEKMYNLHIDNERFNLGL